MDVRFKWFCSYLDQCEYKVFGSTPVRKIEAYRAPAHTLEYYRTIYNHCGDPKAFDLDVIARQGGITITYSEDHVWPQRWTEEFYRAFAVWLKTDHEAQAARLRKLFLERYQEVLPEEPPIEVPRPIYWSQEAHTWETEPFYKEVSTCQSSNS